MNNIFVDSISFTIKMYTNISIIDYILSLQIGIFSIIMLSIIIVFLSCFDEYMEIKFVCGYKK